MGINVRGRYEGLALRLLRDQGPRSRTRLSEDTGLSPTTITKTIAPLLSRGWVEELPDHRAPAGVGRPAITLRQVPEAVTVAAISIGVGTIRVGLSDGWGRIRHARARSFDPGAEPEAVIELAADFLLDLLGTRSGEDSPLAIGVAAPGAVDVERRTNLLSVNLGWHDLPIADIIEARLGLPTYVDHNVRAMALAEARYGAHQADSMAYFYVHKGVGLGLVLHGEPLFGGSHGVSELGHVRVGDDAVACVCGARGCLETTVSEPHLRSRLSDLGVPANSAVLADLESHRLDPAVENVRTRVIADVARALAVVINLFSPDVLVLGGEFIDAPDSLFHDVCDSVRSASFPLLRSSVELVRPTLTEPLLSGGAAVALDMFVYADAIDAR